MKRKWLAVGIILLFIGVAVAPSINASNLKKSSASGPIIDIVNVSYGRGIHADIQNCVSWTLYNVSWNITIEDGIILFGRDKSDVIDVIPPYEKVPIESHPFGFAGLFFQLFFPKAMLIFYAETEDGFSHTFWRDLWIIGCYTQEL